MNPARALCTLVIAVLAASTGCSSDTTPVPAESSPSSAADSGPLNGTFRFDFGPLVVKDDAPRPGSEYTETWVIRSACEDSECVAEAVVFKGTDTAGKAIRRPLLNYVDNQWAEVVQSSKQKCLNYDVEAWWLTEFPTPTDGSATGTLRYVPVQMDACITKRALTVTRTGDADPAVEVRAPADQLPRPKRPAYALRGNYVYTQTMDLADPGAPFSPIDLAARTYCLTSGASCLSVLAMKDTYSVVPLVFADGEFTWTSFGGGQCTDGGGDATSTTTVKFPLPQGDPISVLDGKATMEITAGCPQKQEWDAKLERTP